MSEFACTEKSSDTKRVKIHPKSVKIVQGGSVKNQKSKEEHSASTSKSLPVKINQAELKKIIEECKKTGMNSKKICVVAKKWKRREVRRLRRVGSRKSDKICYKCRQTGHTVSDCTEIDDAAQKFESNASGLCFKCGSTDHDISYCREKTEGFPYANCFICHEMGHLSRDCKQNEKGLYPMGGSCRECGKVDHLVKNCPKLNEWLTDSDKTVKIVAQTDKLDGQIDFEEIPLNSVNAVKDHVKKDRRKIVKF